MDMNLSKLWKMLKDREAWSAAFHGAAKSWTCPIDWTASYVTSSKSLKYLFWHLASLSLKWEQKSLTRWLSELSKIHIKDLTLQVCTQYCFLENSSKLVVVYIYLLIKPLSVILVQYLYCKVGINWLNNMKNENECHIAINSVCYISPTMPSLHRNSSANCTSWDS